MVPGGTEVSPRWGACRTPQGFVRPSLAQDAARQGAAVVYPMPTQKRLTAGEGPGRGPFGALSALDPPAKGQQRQAKENRAD